MQVLSSRFQAAQVAQKNGLRFVEEWHTLDTGEVHWREYGPIATEVADLQEIAENFARQMELDAAQREADAAEET